MSFLSRNILLLSLISLFTDVSSEMLYPVMPLYLASIGMGAAGIGFLEGMAEAIAGLSKGFFGQWSDQIQKRKPFILSGYSLSALSKPLMGISQAIPLVFLARAMDRLGKGIRTASRDALLADESNPSNRGTVFGFHRGMDTLGAAIGPLISLYFLQLHPGQYSALFLWAFIPGLLAILLSWAIREKRSSPTGNIQTSFSLRLSMAYVLSAPKNYRNYYGVMLLFFLANSSDLFILLQMKARGLSDSQLIYTYVGYNLVYALMAYPLGKLFDRYSARNILPLGMIVFAMAYFGFGQSQSLPGFAVSFGIYGLYAAMTEGLGKAHIANLVASEEKATALGNFATMQALAAPVAGLLGGFLWDTTGSASLFTASALLAILAGGLLYRTFRNQAS